MSDTSNHKSATGKSKLNVGKKLLSVGGGDFNKLLPPSIVTPVLRDVGKLAASVAAVNTNGSGGGTGGKTGSATGNPRNKCMLEPGHSLMDWIRLGNSGKDLTGVGALAGKITVSPEEMRTHNKREDAWIAIRGNVYNVTEYLSFHPGGIDEIMKGVGLPDATTLFDEVHPWVNYDKMLTKCYVGRLGTAGPSSKTSDTGNVRFVSPKDSDVSDNLPKPDTVPEVRRYSISINDDRQVRYDWIQKHDLFILYFYTGPYSNPFFDIRRPFENKWTFVITFVESVFTFKFLPEDVLVWPPRFKVFYETGKIEVGFEKQTKKTWANCGTMEHSKRKILPQQCKKKYMIKEHVLLNKHTFLISVQKTDLSLCNTPLGYHILLFNDVNESREFTPVPHLYAKHDLEQRKEIFSSPFITLIIRRYPDGRLSNYLFNKKVGDIIHGSEPIGTFDLQIISDKEHFLFLAGGVGLTPYLGLIQFLLEKKVKPVRSILLTTFHPTPDYQLLDKKLTSMCADPRFQYTSVLTRPPSDYSGVSGHMSSKMFKNLLKKGFASVALAELFFFVCGPASFNSACYDQFQTLNIDSSNTYFFSSASSVMPSTAQSPGSDTKE